MRKYIINIKEIAADCKMHPLGETGRISSWICSDFGKFQQ